jgi:secondary thiamine-phosphate synthase enzyme
MVSMIRQPQQRQEVGMRHEVRTTRREELIDVTDVVARAVAATGVSAGIAVVSSPHTTAGILVNENADPDVATDLIAGLSRLVPEVAGWRHAEGNSDAHLKTALVGTSVMVPIESGRMALGTWQAVYFAEFDGPRSRHLHVSVLSGL